MCQNNRNWLKEVKQHWKKWNVSYTSCACIFDIFLKVCWGFYCFILYNLHCYIYHFVKHFFFNYWYHWTSNYLLRSGNTVILLKLYMNVWIECFIQRQTHKLIDSQKNWYKISFIPEAVCVCHSTASRCNVSVSVVSVDVFVFVGVPCDCRCRPISQWGQTLYLKEKAFILAPNTWNKCTWKMRLEVCVQNERDAKNPLCFLTPGEVVEVV